MTAVLGSVAILLASVAALTGIGLLLRGRARRGERLIDLGRWMAVAVFAAVTLAVVALEVALVGFDFSVRYVAMNVNSGTPLLFRIIGLWGALEGSILLWAWVLAGATALVAVRYRGRYPETVPLALALLLGIAAFFLLLMLGPANPFVRLIPAPAEGRGLNPLLQNHPLMAIHPPFLYLGYVGFSVPYAFAMAALLSRTLRDEWMMVTRRWTVAAWSFLGAGVVLGAWWSYEVLGWGGYWAWDPVENAAIMPWLVATAFLHSVMVQERRQLLRLWNHTLIILAFLLTIFGTFLTRSGILGSVHDFTQSSIGPLFLGFIAIILGFSLFALIARRGEVRDSGTLPAVISRESLFLLNNVVLLSIAATIFIGTTFPLIAEAAAGVKLSVGPPFFNQLTVPLALALLVLMATATLLPWGPPPPGILRRFLAPVLLSALFVAVLAAAGVRRGLTLGAFGVITFTALAQLAEFHRGARALRRAGSRSYPAALLGLFRTNRRRYAGYLAHLGLALAGITASSAYKTESEHTVRRGEVFRGPGYLLRYDGATASQAPDKLVVAATVSILRGFNLAASPEPSTYARIGVLRPAAHLYPQQRRPIPTPAVRSTWRGDLYLVLLAIEKDGSAVFRVSSNPLVPWIWTGGLLMAFAGLVSIWPARRG